MPTLPADIHPETTMRSRAKNLVEHLWKDARHAGRGLRRSPGFTATAVLTLALGIGATTAIFSVVYGVLLKPLPFPDPARLVALYHVTPATPRDFQGDATYFTAVYPDKAIAPACVQCHNQHASSPRHDFALGDVMGGVVVRIAQ